VLTHLSGMARKLHRANAVMLSHPAAMGIKSRAPAF
jgi:hypothetical protein